MSIEVAKPPSQDIEILTGKLRDLDTAPAGRALGAAADLEIREPVPVFAFDLREAEAGNLDKAQQVAWRYLIGDGTRALTADMDTAGGRNADKPSTFSTLTRGPLARSFASALNAVSRFRRAEADDFSLRVLEIASLYTAAIWLRGKHESWFIPFLSEGHVRAAKPQTEAAFLENLQAGAARRLADIRRSSGGEPTARAG